MRLEFSSSEFYGIHQGSIILYDDLNLNIGMLEYHLDVQKNLLHVDNLINSSHGFYRGVGTVLMNEAVKISLKNDYGFTFDIAKGSEGFYRNWIINTFSANTSLKTLRLFERIYQSNKSETQLKLLTGQYLLYTNSEVTTFAKIKAESDFLHCIKFKEADCTLNCV